MHRVLLIVSVLVLAAAAGVFWFLRAGTETPTPAAVTAVPGPPAASNPPAAEREAPRERAAPTSPAPRTRAERPAAEPAPAPSTPATGTLEITSDVAGAQVFLNREFVGTAPVTARHLAPGTYQLNVAAQGYDNYVETIDVGPGAREVAVRFREVRLDAAIDVVHKHRFGSCRGRLVATPEGIRYETSHKEDAFAAPLQALQTFEVDYLDKNLRVQPRGGRRYDFTDPDGDADRLFVFHRDVQRARERLAAGDRPPAP